MRKVRFQLQRKLRQSTSKGNEFSARVPVSEISCPHFRKTLRKGLQMNCNDRCQKFGHVSSNCHSKVSCKHCSGEHSIDNCSGNQPARCTNCSGSHEADSLDCPTYIKQVQRVHEARGLQAPTLRNLVSKNDG